MQKFSANHKHLLFGIYFLNVNWIRDNRFGHTFCRASLDVTFKSCLQGVYEQLLCLFVSLIALLGEGSLASTALFSSFPVSLSCELNCEAKMIGERRLGMWIEEKKEMCRLGLV